jgi:TonB C terminal
VRLRLELEALAVAQAGYVRGAGVKETGSESGSTVQLADILSRNRDGIDSMQCAAYLMGRYRAQGDENVLARSFLITGFKSYAFALESLDVLMREQLVRPKSKQTASIALKDADRYAALMKTQQNGGEIIAEATTISFNMAKDTSAGEDKEIQFLNLNCDEHATLYKISGEIVAPPDTSFSQIADILHGALSRFKCKQMAETTQPARSEVPGVEILSDTEGVDFGPYLRRILADIKRNWLPLIPEEARPAASMQSETLIRVSILPDGRISAMHLDGSSQQQNIDRAAWGAITGEGQFPPLPATFKGQSVELRISFLTNRPLPVRTTPLP